MNKKNIPFYEKVGPHGLKKLGSAVSIDDCKDLIGIHDLISGSRCILEIGAGYGRVIEYISDHFPEKELVGIENCSAMYEYLNSSFSGNTKIVKGCILDYEPECIIPELILWMWSGFSDLSNKEQALALKKLHSISSDKTQIIIDLPDIMGSLEKGRRGTVGKIKNDTLMEIDHPEYGFYAGYIPLQEEMLSMIEESSLVCENIKNYDLDESPRTQYRLRKKTKKTLKFSPPLPEMISAGIKTTTWRIKDDKDFNVGDRISLLARPSLDEFAEVEVVSIHKTQFGNLTPEDWDGHERFSSESEMYETYSRYYSIEADPKTELKVIKFKII